MFNLYQSVIATVDVPSLGLKTGASGVVIDVYSSPYPAYEVEFFDGDGETVGFISMKPDQVILENSEVHA